MIKRIGSFNLGNARVVVLILLIITFAQVEIIEATTPASNKPGIDKIVDCPLIINSDLPSKTVMQVIDNKFHKWKEYELGEDGEICIFLEAPQHKPLNANEARELLKASQQWFKKTEQDTFDLTYQKTIGPFKRPTFEDLPPERIINRPADYDGYVSDKPDTAISKPRNKGVKGDNNFKELDSLSPEVQSINRQFINNPDERERVPFSSCIIYPWNTVGILEVFFPNSVGRGTAFLVGPHTVLTNAHGLYNSAAGGWIDFALFVPGQFQESHDDPIIEPFGYRFSTYGEIPTGYISYEDDTVLSNAYDFGAIYIEVPFSEITTFMPIEFDFSPTYINLAGYPGYLHGQFSYTMWYSHGNVTQIWSHEIDYLASTSSGNSGSPIMVYDGNTGNWRIVGIHAAGGNSFNTGPRFTHHNKVLIEEWMQWIAADAYYNLTLYNIPTDGGTATDLTNTGPYKAGVEVKIKAEPNEDYQFSHWSTSAGGFFDVIKAETTFVMPDESVTVTANFILASSSLYPIHIAPVVGGTAKVETNPSGQAEAGATISIIISDIEEGKQFKAIEVKDNDGNPVVTTETSDGSKYSFIMPDKAVNVIMELEESAYTINTYKVTYGVAAGEGKIVAKINNTNLSSGAQVKEASIITFSATPDAGQLIKDWIVNGSSLGSTALVYTADSLQDDLDVKVEFETIPPPTYNLSMAASPNTGGRATDLTGTGPYIAGAKVNIKAEPKEGYEFGGWSAPAGSFADTNAAETTFTMPTQKVTVTASFTEAIKLGDVNGDGDINVADVVLAMRFSLDIEIPTEKQKATADVNGDGKVDVNDVVLIMRYALGLIDSF